MRSRSACLLFLVWDVLSAAFAPIDAALTSIHDGHGGAGDVARYGALFAVGLAVGLLGLVGYDRYLHRRKQAAAAAVRVPCRCPSARRRHVVSPRGARPARPRC